MSSPRPRPFPGIRANAFTLLLSYAGLALVATATSCRGRSHPTSAVNAVERASPARVFAPRLSIATEYRPCAVLPPKANETVPRDSCGAANEWPPELDALVEVDKSTDPDSLQGSALLEMVAGDSTKALDAAITRLSRALRLSTHPVPLLVDLSAAYLARAQQKQSALDLLRGLDYALDAQTRDRNNAAARFNTALALDLLAVDEQAALAWNAYLRIDSTSGWATEARGRRSALHHSPAPPAPIPGASPPEVEAFATRYPQRARLIGWDSVLGRWGTRLEAGDAAGAANELQLAERLGASLVAHGGDASLADAVRAIRVAADDPDETRTLARAHREYAAGQVLYADLEPAARDSFERVIAAHPRSPVLLRSAELFRAAGLGHSERFTEAEAAFRVLQLQIDSVRYPALAARARWMRGRTLGRNGGQVAKGRPLLEAAARLYERARETEYIGAMLAATGEMAYAQGDTPAAYTLMNRGMRSLRGYRSSLELHKALYVLANCAVIDGMPLAGSIIQEEDFSVASRLEGYLKVEALVGRARVHLGGRQSKDVAQDLERAQSLLGTIHADKPREFFAKTIDYLRAPVAADGASEAALDSAVAFFAAENNPVWFLPALLRRADLRLARGDLAAAALDLDTATGRILNLSQRLDEASFRVAVMEQARSRFDQLAMLHLRAGQKVEALQALERGRVSFAPWAARAGSTGPSRIVAPPGQVAVEYALIGDTLLTWIVRGSDVHLVRDTVDSDGLLWMIEHVDAALESPAHAASALPDLRLLYDLLIQPVEDSLGPPETPLVILADGEVAAVPFAALLNARTNRYLIEDHSLRFAATLADAARPAPRDDGSERPALLVADPAFDPRQYPLDRLRGARAEVDSLRRIYRSNVTLAGSSATRDSFVLHAPGAGVIHYAGHAVFDDARPERSGLVLAGADSTGLLTADAVNSLQLRGVRLVVLASCSTVRSRTGRSGGFSGLSGALLAAGAGGVVGSLWQADDRLTQPLMLEFHRAYHRRPDDAAAALRHAQIRMLHDSPGPRSLAAWAGFRYMGS